jgi:hypothetical protein
VPALNEPMAIAVIQWIPTANDGRLSGPPTAPVYTATAAFRINDAEPWNTDVLLSILVQRIATLNDGQDLANIGFLTPGLARPQLHPGAEIVITEGPKPVAHAYIRELL